MKKNLKKLISAVIAFAIAGSMIPASFAAKIVFPDVADTASYATPVYTLVALDIIAGNGEGQFLPDNLITRAEATKIVVAALNETAKAEGKAASSISFKDVANDYWAKGYIAQGVADGFIAGRSATKFDPTANVTYAEIIKMLVAALGYNEYATYFGGWPNGYITVAENEEITDGVSKGNNEYVTRAEVAQLVYNALNTPIVNMKGGMTYTDGGKLVPSIERYDGKDDKAYRSLLTDKFDAYLVDATVTATNRSDDSLDADEVRIEIIESENYDVETTQLKTEGSQLVVKVGDTDIANYLGIYGTAIIFSDGTEDEEAISFIPSGKNKSVKIDASLLDDDANSFEFGTGFDGYVKFFASETATKSTKYTLASNCMLFVNGVAYNGPVTIDTLKAAVGEIELVDSYKTDGKYDKIYINVYLTAQVDQVSTNDELRLKKVGGNGYATIDLDTEANDDLVCHIYLNGEEISLNQLQKDDIVSIAYNCDYISELATTQDYIDRSHFFDIYVSRDTQVGKVTKLDPEDEVITVGGETYSFVNSYDSEAGSYNLGDEYTIYLDAFGRIFLKEDYELNANYAILHKVTRTDDTRLSLVTTEGTVKTYYIDATKLKAFMGDVNYNDLLNNTDYRQDTLCDVENRVVEYKVSSTSGKITELTFISNRANTLGAVDGKEEFRERTNAVGGIKLSSATKVFDATEYVSNGYDEAADLSVENVSWFTDGTDYKVYAFGKKASDNTYPLILVTEGKKSFSVDSRVAIVQKSVAPTTDEETGDELCEIPALYNGEEIVLTANDDCASAAKDLKTGDIFMFTTDSKGLIDEITLITSFSGSPIDEFFFTLPDSSKGDFTSDWYVDDRDTLQFVCGPIVEAEDNYFTVAQNTDDLIDLNKQVTADNIYDGVLDIDLSSDTNLYFYDGKKAKNNFSLNGSIVTSILPDAVRNDDKISWSTFETIDAQQQLAGKTLKTDVAWAFALVVDGEAVDVLVLTNTELPVRPQ